MTLCGNVGAMDIWSELKAYTKEKGLQKDVRIVKSGCLDYCGKGPIVCVQPEQKWFSRVGKEDVARIKKEWIDPLAENK
jgi:(2Fe-2S) ferredoxin